MSNIGRRPPAIVRLYILIATAIGLSFMLTFSSSSTFVRGATYSLNVPHPPTNNKEEVSFSSLNKAVRDKADELRKIVSVGQGKQFAPLDPLILESIWLLFNDEHGYMNASTQNLLLRGLSHIDVQDVATNEKTRTASVYFRTDRLILTGDYQIKHKNKEDIIDDYGKFSIHIKQLSTSWSGTVGTTFNSSFFQISELSVDSRVEDVTQEFSSATHGTKLPSKLEKVLKEVTATVIDKVKKEIDDKLYSASEKIAKVSAFKARFMSGPEALEKVNTFNLKRLKRQVPCERGEELDEYVDSLFRFASRLIRAMEPFSGTIPNVTAEVPELNLIIFLHQGGATHAYTIQRKKPAWVMCTNESISLGLTVGFEELRVLYKFRIIQDWKLLFDGEMEAQITKPKVQVQFTQTTPDEDSDEQVQQRIDALRIWSLGQIRIMLKGLGNITQAMSIFLTGFVNRNIDNFMPSLRSAEDQAITFANMLLQNISIPFFSII